MLYILIENFSYQCTSLGRILSNEKFFWNITVNPLCCLYCDNTVYKEDSIITSVERNDDCGTIETSVCRKFPDLDSADIEVEYKHKKCCVDSDGLHPLDTKKNIAETCSKKVCYYSKSLSHARWVYHGVTTIQYIIFIRI